MDRRLIIVAASLGGLCVFLAIGIVFLLTRGASRPTAEVTSVAELAPPFVETLVAGGYLIDGQPPRDANDSAIGRARTGFSSLDTPGWNGELHWVLKPKHGNLVLSTKRPIAAAELDGLASEWGKVQRWFHSDDFSAGQRVIAKAREQVLNGPRDQWGGTSVDASEDGKHFRVSASGLQQRDYSDIRVTFSPRNPTAASHPPAGDRGM